LYCILQVLANVTSANGFESLYAQVMPLTRAGFLCFLLLTLLSMNRQSLTDAVNAKRGVPESMRRKNTVLAFALFAFVVLSAYIPQVISAVERTLEWLWMAMLRIVEMLASLLPDASTGEGGGGMGGGGELGFGEAGEPSLLAVIMEKIFIVVAIIIGVGLLILFGYVLWKRLRVLLKFLWEKLGEYAASSTKDYVDEISDTREDGERRRLLRKSRKAVKDALKHVDEASLTPAERIRYRYLRLWLRHPEWKRESTARENLPEDAAQLYERARYSEHGATQSEAEAFAGRADAL